MKIISINSNNQFQYKKIQQQNNAQTSFGQTTQVASSNSLLANYAQALINRHKNINKTNEITPIETKSTGNVNWKNNLKTQSANNEAT